MFELIEELYPICRSITGDGLRRTLEIIRRHVPLQVVEVPTGTQVFDWLVPNEWNIKDAYVKDRLGRRVIDFQRSNLHIVQYSQPIDTEMTMSELEPYLHVLNDHPDWIPYRTSYYNETWGFCLSQRDLEALKSETSADQKFEVRIDSTLEPGSLSYGELVVPGRTNDEILVSTHSCHPSLCNDNLSGIALAVNLAKYVMAAPRKYTYRFLFVPGTIGSITWLARNEDAAKFIKHGLVVACVGDTGRFHYKRSRRGVAEIDHAVEHVLSHLTEDYVAMDFSPYGYDERQYCSPGFDLPVGSLTRSPHSTFPEYHTSADNLDFIDEQALDESLGVYKSVMDVLEGNVVYLNTNPKCEPQLGKRGLYGGVGGSANIKEHQMALLWVLNLSDGTNSLLDIAQRSGLLFQTVRGAANALLEAALLVESAHQSSAAETTV